MMGFGHMGSVVAGANSSSSTSNLSALAPPFTVDRLNPNKPNSNPTMHYSDSNYPVEPFNQSWQYPRPSAPGSELITNSTEISSLPLYDNYQFSASANNNPSSTHWSATSPSVEASSSMYGYNGEIDPYYSYSPYVPRMVGENSPVVEDNGARESVIASSGLKTSSSELEPYYSYSPYVPRMVGEASPVLENNGSRESVMCTSGLSVSSPIDYAPGLFDLEYGRQWDGYGLDGGKRAKRIELSGSFFSEKPYAGDSVNFKNQLSQGESSIGYWNKSKEVSDRELNHGSLSVGLGHMEDKSCLEQTFGFLPYESNKTQIPASSSTYPESHPLVSGEMHKNFSNYQNTITSPYEKRVKPLDSVFTGSVSAIRSSPSVVIRPPPATNGNLGQTSVSRKPETNIFDFSSQGADHIFVPSISVKKSSKPLNNKDDFDRQIKARFELPDITNVSGGFSMPCEESSDFIDNNHNTSVDSPCWKGASSSQFSPFDAEAGNSNHRVKKNLNEYYGFNHEERHNLQPIVDSTRINDENAKNDMVFSLERTFDAICPSRETNDGQNIPSKELGLLSSLKSGFDLQFSGLGELGTRMALNDVSEGGVVAVHMAEKVLASPSSQEDVTEPTKLPDPKLNVPTMIKAIHNLSELLLFHLSNDACFLDKENTETLKNVISNLDSCASKKIALETDKLELNNPAGDNSDKLGASSNVGTIPGSPHTAYNHRRMPEEKINYSFSGGNNEKSQVLSSLRDELDITREDDMAEAIKKVLEENFDFNEEMHPQALLFKSLWLEAEAKLCSISYKARFDQMKTQMEKFKHNNATQENEDIADMIHKVSISPDPNTTSTAHANNNDEEEASVMARFNILKSREENPKPTSIETDPVMARLYILKSRDEKSKSVNNTEDEEKQQHEHVGPVMARFNILKSLHENSKSINIEEKEKYVCPEESEEEILNVAVKPHFLHETGGPSNGKFKNNMIVNQDYSGWKDSSSSSDWEHVLKDDFSWKNL